MKNHHPDFAPDSRLHSKIYIHFSSWLTRARDVSNFRNFLHPGTRLDRSNEESCVRWPYPDELPTYSMAASHICRILNLADWCTSSLQYVPATDICIRHTRQLGQFLPMLERFTSLVRIWIRRWGFRPRWQQSVVNSTRDKSSRLRRYKMYRFPVAGFPLQIKNHPCTLVCTRLASVPSHKRQIRFSSLYFLELNSGSGWKVRIRTPAFRSNYGGKCARTPRYRSKIGGSRAKEAEKRSEMPNKHPKTGLLCTDGALQARWILLVYQPALWRSGCGNHLRDITEMVLPENTSSGNGFCRTSSRHQGNVPVADFADIVDIADNIAMICWHRQHDSSGMFVVSGELSSHHARREQGL